MARARSSGSRRRRAAITRPMPAPRTAPTATVTRAAAGTGPCQAMPMSPASAIATAYSMALRAVRQDSLGAGGWGSWWAVCMEDLLHGVGEEAGEGDRERQRGGVAAGLDGVDGLAGHAHGLGELALRQAFVGTQLADVVAHADKAPLHQPEMSNSPAPCVSV